MGKLNNSGSYFEEQLIDNVSGCYRSPERGCLWMSDPRRLTKGCDQQPERSKRHWEHAIEDGLCSQRRGEGWRVCSSHL